MHLRDLLSHDICFSEVDEMSEANVLGTGMYMTLINPVMTQIEFFFDVRIHMDANNVMRTFSGKVFTGNAFLVSITTIPSGSIVLMSFGKDSTQVVSPHSEWRLALTV